MQRNPRVLAAVVMLGLFAISQGVEQATQGKYPTPALTAEVVKISIVALSSAGVLAEVFQRLLRSGNGKSDKKEIEPPPPTKEDDTK